MARWADERGDVILSGLGKMLAGLILLGVVLFDGGAVVVNRVQLDEAARSAARVGAVTWSQQGSSRAVERAVLGDLSGQSGMALDAVTVTDARVEVTVSRHAAVLVLDRLGPLARHVQGSATSVSGPPRS